LTSVAIYGGGLLAVLVISALYNLWPVSPVKWVLRRFDHSAIYLLIAGTYTPFIMQMRSEITAIVLLVGVCAGSLAGMALKLCLPGRFDRLAILLYLLLGWSGVMAYEAVLGALPGSTLTLLAAGGLLYTVGVVFHVWEGLRFQNAIWHAFVLVAAAAIMGRCWTAWCWRGCDHQHRLDTRRMRVPSVAVLRLGQELVEDSLNVRGRVSARDDVDHTFRLMKREPVRTKRHGISAARVMPIRTPVVMSTGFSLLKT
jgi:hemolysin III